jgi:hypothetical protein
VGLLVRITLNAGQVLEAEAMPPRRATDQVDFERHFRGEARADIVRAQMKAAEYNELATAAAAAGEPAPDFPPEAWPPVEVLLFYAWLNLRRERSVAAKFETFLSTIAEDGYELIGTDDDEPVGPRTDEEKPAEDIIGGLPDPFGPGSATDIVAQLIARGIDYATIRDAPPEVLDRLLTILSEGGREAVHAELRRQLEASGA